MRNDATPRQAPIPPNPPLPGTSTSSGEDQNITGMKWDGKNDHEVFTKDLNGMTPDTSGGSEGRRQLVQ